MPLIAKMSGGAMKARKPELSLQRQELLAKKTEFLKDRINHELSWAKKNCKVNRRVALQALKRKKGYEKHLKHINCAFEAMKSAEEHIEIINKMNELIKETTADDDSTFDSLYASLNEEGEFDEISISRSSP